jgi:hypothetical protein
LGSSKDSRIVFACVAFGFGLHVKETLQPEIVIQRQLDAYNARDINALIATYADDIELIQHPSTLLAKGLSQARERQSIRLMEPNLHAQLVKRMVMGNIVIDQEVVTRTFPEGPGTVELIAMYQVVENKIAKAWFIFGAKTLDVKTSG